MTGFCRTGEMFAADLYKVESDLRTMGKGINNSYLPCGALGVTDRIIEVIHGSSLSGFTHAGHPRALAAVDAALNVYLEAHVGPRDCREHVSQGTLWGQDNGANHYPEPGQRPDHTWTWFTSCVLPTDHDLTRRGGSSA